MYKLFWPWFYHFCYWLCVRNDPQSADITLVSGVGYWLKTILRRMWKLCHLTSNGQTLHSLSGWVCVHPQDLLLALISNWFEMYVRLELLRPKPLYLKLLQMLLWWWRGHWGTAALRCSLPPARSLLGSRRCLERSCRGFCGPPDSSSPGDFRNVSLVCVSDLFDFDVRWLLCAGFCDPRWVRYEGCVPAKYGPPKAIYIAEGGQLAVGMALSIVFQGVGLVVFVT